MKPLLVVCSFLLMISCSPKIDEHFIKKNESELLSIAQESLKPMTDSNESLRRIRDLGMESIRIQYQMNSSDYIQADSLVYFPVNNGTLLDPQKNVVYDFSATPKKFGDAEFVGAS